MKATFALSLMYSAAAVLAAPSFSYETIHDGAAPLISSADAVEVPNSYIVKFKKHVSDASASDHHSWIQQLHSDREQQRIELRKRGDFSVTDETFRGLAHTFKIGGEFLGYSGHFEDSTIEELRRHPDVCELCTLIMHL